MSQRTATLLDLILLVLKVVQGAKHTSNLIAEYAAGLVLAARLLLSTVPLMLLTPHISPSTSLIEKEFPSWSHPSQPCRQNDHVTRSCISSPSTWDTQKHLMSWLWIYFIRECLTIILFSNESMNSPLYSKSMCFLPLLYILIQSAFDKCLVISTVCKIISL